MSRYQPTSMRLSPEELELLDAWAEWLCVAKGENHTRTGVVRSMLRRSSPPAAGSPHGLSAAAVRLRSAYTTIFGQS